MSWNTWQEEKHRNCEGAVGKTAIMLPRLAIETCRASEIKENIKLSSSKYETYTLELVYSWTAGDDDEGGENDERDHSITVTLLLACDCHWWLATVATIATGLVSCHQPDQYPGPGNSSAWPLPSSNFLPVTTRTASSTKPYQHQLLPWSDSNFWRQFASL